MKKLLLCLLLAFIWRNLGAQKASAFPAFNSFSHALLQNNGLWLAKNPRWKPADSLSAQYVGYSFSRGIHPNQIRFTTEVYLPLRTEWKTIWTEEFQFDVSSNKILYHGINDFGNVVTGFSESHTAKNAVLVYTLIVSPGSKTEFKNEKRISGDSLISETFAKIKGKWSRTDVFIFTKRPIPQGEISFTSTRDGHYDVYLMDAMGAKDRNLTSNQGTDYWGSWIPGSERLLFYSNRTGNEDIFVMDANGKNVVNLTNHPKADRIPNPSPDGKKIVFVSNRDHPQGEIYTIDRDGSNLTRLTNNTFFEDGAFFSPDGKCLLFSRQLPHPTDSTKSGSGEIFSMNIDGTNEKQLTNRGGWNGSAQFSPDMTKIAFNGKSESGNTDLLLMNPDGSNITQLTNDKHEDYSPDWSPDGKWIAFTKGNSKNYDIWLLHLETGIQSRLTHQPKRDETPFWKR